MKKSGFYPYRKYIAKFEYKGNVIERSIIAGPFNSFEFTFDCLYPGAKLINFYEEE